MHAWFPLASHHPRFLASVSILFTISCGEPSGTRLAPLSSHNPPVVNSSGASCPKGAVMRAPRSLRAPVLLILPALVLAGCRGAKPGPQAPPPPTVTVSRPVVRDITEHRYFTGHIDARESVEVRARVQGFLEKIHFQEG